MLQVGKSLNRVLKTLSALYNLWPKCKGADMTGTWLLVATILLLSPSEPNWAQVVASEKDPQRLIKRTMDQVLLTLQSEQMDLPTKKAKIVEIVSHVLDIDVMARLSVGRYWSTLNQQQQRRFTQLFFDLLKDTYLRKLSDYNDQKIVMQPGKTADKRAQIPTELVLKDKTIPIVYKLHISSDRWRVYDVEIEGVSLVMTYRSQFQDILQKATFDQLLDQLQQRLSDPNQPKND